MKKMLFALFLSGFMLLFWFQPASAESGQKSKTPKKSVIGVILPFSSAFKDIANEEKNAIEMALAEAVSQAEVIFKDGGNDPEGAIQAFKALAERKQKPVAVISCASWASNAIHPLAAKADIFHIAIGSAIIDRKHSRRTVRFTLDAEQEERQLAEYLSKFNRIAVYNMDNGYGNNWADIIKDNFQDKIVASIAYDPQSPDLAPELSAIKKENPDALVLLSAGNAALIAKQAKKMGIDAQLVGTRPIERPGLLDEPAANGLVYTYPSHSFSHPLLAEYEKAHGTPPTFFGIEAYDAVTTLISALKANNDSPDMLFDWYAGRTYNGALGEVHFDENGDASYPYMYKQVREGKFEVADFQFALLLCKPSSLFDNTRLDPVGFSIYHIQQFFKRAVKNKA
ncbi:MAG: ABC transporter substrate-binding protein, partial [Desulfosalsimonas sp.]|uniref:ABC transporter substrate-binding protein n=1 Tax=Desulfosalsimonas sp. TaxID=3073848 RepID=UPI003970696B